ncbi:hypothetical protein FGO68_gene14977 [Halteria grandinella]|uniref:Uncharacterized protein n=1 Tax=Halteria grandinella TaxID=5974 RepID=A0A8J8SYR4_HALGN|nr:hypothetical protein FGO68_gene14977 [Halteria grandinella]
MNSTQNPGDIPPKIVLRIVMLGSYGVGKTSFLVRHFDEKFPRFGAIGLDQRLHIEERDGKQCKFQVWDLVVGNFRHSQPTPQYYKSANGILIFVDLSSDICMRAQLNHWMSEIEKKASDNVCRLLVGTKCDLPQLISDEEFEEFASMYNMPCIKTSSKDNTNLSEAMQLMMDAVYRQSKNFNFTSQPMHVNAKVGPALKSKSCFI